MSNTLLDEFGIEKFEIDVTYSEAALKKARSKYSFGFTIDGETHRVGYDPDEDVTFFDCGDAGESLFQLTQEINETIKQFGSKLDIDLLDLRKFAVRHLQAMNKVEKELERSPDFGT